MPETLSANSTSQMSSQIKTKLREDGLRLREAKPKELQAMKVAMLKEVYRMLCLCLGVPPTEFTWARYDAKGPLCCLRFAAPESVPPCRFPSPSGG